MSGFPYSDILNMKYPNPEIEKDFPDKLLRAAQFAPFAALTGYDDAVAETERLTERKLELSEDAKAQLDEKLRRIEDSLGGDCPVSVTYFVPDPQKEGGKYLVHSGVAAAIKGFERQLVFADGTEIAIDDIAEIAGEWFDFLQ